MAFFRPLGACRRSNSACLARNESGRTTFQEVRPLKNLGGSGWGSGPAGMIESPAGGFSRETATMCDVTQILGKIEAGDPSAAEQLLPLVYEELRKLAAAKMAQEKPDQTLQATALVHEAYIRLVDTEKAQHWNSRGHFFAAAAEAMRRILVEQERHKRGVAAGGKHQRVTLSHVDPSFREDQLSVLALSDALDKLRGLDPRAAELVKLRFFAGLTRQQAADVLGVSVATVDNDWVYAKCWLQIELTGTAGSET
jgi:RNA polymerase sigma factor (TIGR02999 family)